MENNYLMIISAVILLLFLLYKEMRRVNRDRLFLRLFAVLVAVGALVLLAFPIQYKVQGDTKASELNLLSRGADLSQLEATTYFTTDSSVLRSAGTRPIKYIPDLAYYLQVHQEISHLKVKGFGLNSGELKGLKNYAFDFQPAPSPEGIISCSWPRSLKQTALLDVQGIYNNTSEKPVKLLLQGLGLKLDSMVVSGHTRQNFSLKSPARQLGKTVYSLTAYSGTDTLQQEKIPFQVTASPKLKLLILSSFPDFEYKFLKNWLYENKYQVVYRTRISKDKFSVDELNTSAVNAEVLNATMLGKFDLVIADDEELSKLDPAAVSSLRLAVSKGTGLLVRMNDSKALSVFAKTFKLYKTTDSGTKSFKPAFAGEAAMHPVPGSPGFYIQPQSGEQPLLKDETEKVLLSSALYGNGKLAVSTVAATYNWILSGEQPDYAKFWSGVISKLVRKDEGTGDWNIIPSLPVTDQQSAIIYQINATHSIPDLTIDQKKLSSTQHLSLPFVWKATFWAEHLGWNELKIENNAPDYFFVYNNQDWMAFKEQQSLLENLSYAKKSNLTAKTGSIQSEKLEKEVSSWWFFALFLISTAYIWFETKLL